MADEILNEELNTDTEPSETPSETPSEETTPTIVDKVKLALRISHNLLDGEITDVIASARQELIRAGVDSEVANSDREIVQTAIKTYALQYYASDVKEAERFGESFGYQCDCLRKSVFTVEE